MIKAVNRAKMEAQEKLQQNDIGKVEGEDAEKKSGMASGQQTTTTEHISTTTTGEDGLVYNWIGETGMALSQSWADIERPTATWDTFAGVLNCSSVDYKSFRESPSRTDHNYLHLQVSV